VNESTTLRFAGFGGQGIIKAAEIFGAAAVVDGKRVMQNSSYGSSARGGLCTADVAVGSGEIYEIEPDRFDVLIALNQDSCDAYVGEVKPGGVLIYEADLVKPPADQGGAHAIAATRIAAEDLGRRIVTNMVVLGFCGALTGLLSRAALEQTIRANVPRGTETLNLKAFAEGWARGAAATDKRA
jgi:2-oxoglutarate ferredoxin oxidoreductase subunit gamma